MNISACSCRTIVGPSVRVPTHQNVFDTHIKWTKNTPAREQLLVSLQWFLESMRFEDDEKAKQEVTQHAELSDLSPFFPNAQRPTRDLTGKKHVIANSVRNVCFTRTQ